MKAGRFWTVFSLRSRSLFRRRVVESELEKELRFHLEHQTAENIAQGLPADQARLAALRQLGGLTQIQEECRDMRRTNPLSDFLQDTRYAFRSLRNSPGFAAVIILTMALAIGANSAIFSVIHGVMLKALPYSEPDRLVRVYLKSPNFPKFPLNPFDFRDYRTRATSFESMAAYTHADRQLSGSGQPVRLSGFSVTAGFFHVLGLRPILGREFSKDDELPERGRVVVLSDPLWRSRFHAQPDIVGRQITLDSSPYTVVGVMPRRAASRELVSRRGCWRNCRFMDSIHFPRRRFRARQPFHGLRGPHQAWCFFRARARRAERSHESD